MMTEQQMRMTLAMFSNPMFKQGAKAQQAWHEIVDKLLTMSHEITKSFFDVLKQTTPEKGK